ncbi:MAG: hypothetical protein L0Y72_18420 [Gemmataceae bacterium]|nr:hypothetical protein [Gemmataceae bacterium]MCI0741027.1 hypothetical protein [Gemmataceae bacterium]
MVGNEIIVNAADLDNAFADQVAWHTFFTLNWQLSPDDGRSWIAPALASQSQNEICVTLGAPPAGQPMYHTVVWMGSRNGAGSTTQQELIDGVWAVFETTGVVNRASQPLHYYGNWTTTSANVEALLRTRDGMCGSWANFFLHILRAQGITTARLRFVIPKYTNVEGFLVKNWEFPGIKNFPATYQMGAVRYARLQGGQVVQGPVDYLSYGWFNFPNDGDTMQPNFNAGELLMDASKGAGEFLWQGTAWVTDADGIHGQNADNPYSMFRDHVLVTFNDVLYDPSYGKLYDGADALDKFETNAIAGYVRERAVNEMSAGEYGAPIDLNHNGTTNEDVEVRVFLFRTNGPGNDVI